MSVILDENELVELTGYRQPSKQLSELLRQGFHRARRTPAGNVVLERAHFEAVSSSRGSNVVDLTAGPRWSKAA